MNGWNVFWFDESTNTLRRTYISPCSPLHIVQKAMSLFVPIAKIIKIEREVP